MQVVMLKGIITWCTQYRGLNTKIFYIYSMTCSWRDVQSRQMGTCILREKAWYSHFQKAPTLIKLFWKYLHSWRRAQWIGHMLGCAVYFYHSSAAKIGTVSMGYKSGTYFDLGAPSSSTGRSVVGTILCRILSLLKSPLQRRTLPHPGLATWGIEGRCPRCQSPGTLDLPLAEASPRWRWCSGPGATPRCCPCTCSSQPGCSA